MDNKIKLDESMQELLKNEECEFNPYLGELLSDKTRENIMKVGHC